jgi:RNA polymerase primary sigma factor
LLSVAGETSRPPGSSLMVGTAPMDAVAGYLRDHRLAPLFVDALGWDRASGTQTLTTEGCSLCFQAIAQKRALQVLWCSADRVVLVNRGLLRKFQSLVARTFHEHILIFSSEVPRKQVWAWCIRLPDGRKLRHREHPFFSATPPSPFLHRLEQLRFSLDEEECISLVDALDRVRRVLDTSPELHLFARRPRYAARSDELARAMREGDVEAFHRFVLLHRPLARRQSKCLRRWFGMPEEDAEQIGFIGLIEAARRFRPERGFQFSTYATWWIKQACQRYGPDAALLIRVPPHAFWSCFRHGIAIERLRLDDGPSAVRDRVCELELANPLLAAQWRGYLRARNVGTLSDRALLREARAIPAPTGPPVDNLIRSEVGVEVRIALGRLHPRDAEVIRLRYGLDDREHTLEEIGHQMGLTRERIRQIERKAEAKLRTLLGEEGRQSVTTPRDVGSARSAPLLCRLSEHARLAPGVCQDIRTFIRNGSG